jgi:hypothetical protein
VLEHTGEHAQAAALRLEYAQTLCGTVQRIAMLREGCARNSGATEEGRALHQALAETLLRHAEFMEDGAPRRAILMEAARALEEADQGAVAGEIYERLGMHRRAARAYERAGAISQLEYVLGLLERHEQIEQALQERSTRSTRRCARDSGCSPTRCCRSTCTIAGGASVRVRRRRHAPGWSRGWPRSRRPCPAVRGCACAGRAGPRSCCWARSCGSVARRTSSCRCSPLLRRGSASSPSTPALAPAPSGRANH